MIPIHIVTIDEYLDGAVQGAYGLATKDEHHKEKGLSNIKDSATATVKGVGHAVVYIAVVSTLVIGFVDVIDGANVVEADGIDTRNADLNGYEHPETGVPFVEKTVELPNG